MEVNHTMALEDQIHASEDVTDVLRQLYKETEELQEAIDAIIKRSTRHVYRLSGVIMAIQSSPKVPVEVKKEMASSLQICNNIDESVCKLSRTAEYKLLFKYFTTLKYYINLAIK